MLIADWVAVALVAFFALLGLLFGFGKGLRFFTKGIFGFIISIMFCYCFGGLIYKLSFVQQLLTMMAEALAVKGGFCNFLLTIRIDIIVYYVALFIVVQIVRIIIVRIISSVFEIENVFLKLINKVFGVALFLGVLVFIVLLVFQIIYALGGNIATDFAAKLTGSTFKLDYIYEHNPLIDIVTYLFKITIVKPVV